LTHIISLTLILGGVWWILSGLTLTLILYLGAGSIFFIVWICHRMDTIDHETHPIHLATGIITYFPWLIWKIVLANLDVAKAILMNNSSIRPRLMRIKASQVSEVGLVTYANSITLTPGTVTLDVEGEDFLIHSLTEGSYNDLLGGEMDQRITNLELDKLGPKTKQQPALKDHPEDFSKKPESET